MIMREKISIFLIQYMYTNKHVVTGKINFLKLRTGEGITRDCFLGTRRQFLEDY